MLTDVEGMYSNATDYHEHLLMGCQIVTAYDTKCSLGGFVELDNGKIGCLTSGYVFATDASAADFRKNPVNWSHLRREVYQPQLSPNYEFGRMVKCIIDSGDSKNVGVAAAAIEITKPHRYPCTGEFPDAVSYLAGFSSEEPMVFNTGKIIERLSDIPLPCTVVKYGAGTGHTIGQLRLAGPAVHVYSPPFNQADRFELHQQFEVFSINDQAFADLGDSGALVFSATKFGSDMEVRALGLIVGATDYGTTIVTPLWAVLEKLHLPLKLLSFGNPVGLSEEPVHQTLKKIESDVDMLKQNAEATEQLISSLVNKIDVTDRRLENWKAKEGDSTPGYDTSGSVTASSIEDTPWINSYPRKKLEEIGRQNIPPLRTRSASLISTTAFDFEYWKAKEGDSTPGYDTSGSVTASSIEDTPWINSYPRKKLEEIGRQNIPPLRTRSATLISTTAFDFENWKAKEGDSTPGYDTSGSVTASSIEDIPWINSYPRKKLEEIEKDSLKTLPELTNKHYRDLINENMVVEFITKRGPRSKEVRLFLAWLCSCVENMLISVERVWTGYEPRYILSPVFVAEVTKETQSTPSLLNRFKIIQRRKGYVSDEAEYVSNMEMRKGLVFTAEEQVAIQKCLTKHTDTLMKKHSNLLIVSAAKIKSKNHGNKGAVYEETTCIVFYVHIKGIIPFDEDAFPTELEGFPVDIREGKFKTFSNASDYHERLRMGCQIVTAYNICSLGGFIELETGNIGCLTCAHAFYTHETVADFKHDRFKKEVFQPQLEQDFEFGKMVKYVRDAGDSENIGVDAALIEITKPHRHPNSGDFPDATSREAGFSSEKPMVFSTGKIIERLEEIPIPCMVVKYGARTGHTIGLLRLAGPAVRVYSSAFYPGDGIELNQQLEVSTIKGQEFADHGDSGSLVFLVTKSGSDMEVRALGLLVGGTTYGTTIVTPIWAVLNKLNLPLRLFSFENPVGLSIDPADQRFERIESDVELLKQNTEETKQKIGSLENKIDISDRKQDERSASIENKVSSLENKMDVADRKQDERSASIENKLEAQQIGMKKIEAQQSGIKNELEAQHTDISKILDVLLHRSSKNE